MVYDRLSIVRAYKEEFTNVLNEGTQEIKTIKGDIKFMIQQIPGEPEKLERFFVTNQIYNKLFTNLNQHNEKTKKFILYSVISEIIALVKRSVAPRKISAASPNAHFLLHLSQQNETIFTLLSGIISLDNNLFIPYSDPNDFKEETEPYLKAITGYSAIYAYYLFSDLPIATKFRLKMAWIFISQLCNQPPNYASASILDVFLEVGAPKLLFVYKEAFKNILHIIYTDWWSWVESSFQSKNISIHNSFRRIKTSIEKLLPQETQNWK